MSVYVCFGDGLKQQPKAAVFQTLILGKIHENP